MLTAEFRYGYFYIYLIKHAFLMFSLGTLPHGQNVLNCSYELLHTFTYPDLDTSSKQ